MIRKLGVPRPLHFLPATLVLQAEDAEWTLARSDLPAGLMRLPMRERIGLFQLRTKSVHPRVKSGEKYIAVKRTMFPILPADTITVYAAQGGTYDAVIADLAKPPSMPGHIHWLVCYVMLSRARSLEGLLLLRPATRAELNAGGPPWLLAELERLETLERDSHSELVRYLEGLPDSIIPRTIKDLLTEDAVRTEALRVAEVRGRSAPEQKPAPKGVPIQCPPFTASAPQTLLHPSAHNRKQMRHKTPWGLRWWCVAAPRIAAAPNLCSLRRAG